jgi:hypothetical protein
MSALMIGPGEKKAIAALIEKAKKHRFSYQRMREYASGARPINRKLMSDLTILIPAGFTVTYSIEDHAPKVPCHHLSVAAPRADRVPNEFAIAMILREFGMMMPLDQSQVYPEEFEPNRIAINVIQPVDGDWTPLMR